MYDRIEKNYYNEDDICSVFSKYIDIESPKKTTLKLVFNYFNNNWHFLIGKAYLEEQSESENYIYPDLVFISMTMEISSFKEFIKVLQTDGISCNDKYPIIKPNKLNWKERLIPTSYTQKLPIRSFEINVCDNARNFIERKLIAYKQPYFNSSKDLVSKFVNLSEFHGSSDGRIGCLLIECADERGHLVFDGEQLNAFTDEPASIIGEITYKDLCQPILLDKSEELSIDKDNLKSCDVFLVNEENEVLDFITSTSHYEFSIKIDHANEENTEKTLIELIEGGEGEQVEFKPFIGLNKGSKKEEIDKTVCAFSNNSGGVLFIGVDDFGVVAGIECGEFGKQFKNDVNIYVNELKKHLTDRLRINDCYEVLAKNICSEKVIMITVNKANGCNEIVSNRVVYIRRGATSMQASSDDIVKLSNSISEEY
jgi:hypothetical protein